MRKILVTLLMSISFFSAICQEIEKGSMLLHIGAGKIVSTSDEANGTPFGGSFEYFYSDIMSIGILANAHSGSDNDPLTGYSYSGFELDLKHAAHLRLGDNLSANLGALVGYDMLNSSRNDNSSQIITIPESRFSFGLMVGANYLFSDNVGLYLDGIQNFSTALGTCVVGGLLIKFN